MLKSLLNVRLAEARRTKRSVACEMGVTPETLWRWSTDEGIEGMCLRDIAHLASCLRCEAKDLFETRHRPT